MAGSSDINPHALADAPQARTARFEVAGTSLNTEVRGSGRAVLLIGAADEDAEFYRPVAERLADELTAVTYDRRGTRRSGREDWPGGGSVQHADDAAAPVKALGINRVTVMGFSAGGAAVTLVVGAALVAVSSSLLDGLDITPETWRIAAGMVATVVGLTVLAFPSRADEPRLPGNGAALVPVTFPLLLTPELVAFVSIFGATEPATRSIGGLIAALALGIAAARIGYRRPTLWLAGARFFAALLILSGVAMIVEGIRDV